MSNSVSISAKLAMVLALAICGANSAGALQSVGEPDPGSGNRLNAGTISLTEQKSFFQEKIVEAKQAMVQRSERINEAIIHAQEFEARRKELLKKQDEIGVSSESFGEIMRMLQASRVELMIDLAGSEARRVALQKSISEQIKTVEFEAQLALKKEFIELQGNILDRTKELYEKGSAPQESYIRARQEFLVAKIELAEYQRSSEQTGNSATAIQLLDVSLERAEKTARLAKVESLLGQFAAERESIQEVGKLEGQLDVRAMKINQFENERLDFETRIRNYELELEKLEKLLGNTPKADK